MKYLLFLIKAHLKLIDERGETIVETLISVLVSSLALLMMATAIGTSVNIVLQSRGRMERFYQDENTMVGSSIEGTDSSSVGYTTDVAIRTKEVPETSGSLKVYSTTDGSVSLYKGE